MARSTSEERIKLLERQIDHERAVFGKSIQDMQNCRDDLIAILQQLVDVHQSTEPSGEKWKEAREKAWNDAASALLVHSPAADADTLAARAATAARHDRAL